jgi:hypothetical protein
MSKLTLTGRCSRKAVDPRLVSPDAEFILEGGDEGEDDEWDFRWVLCRPDPRWYRDSRGYGVRQVAELLTSADDQQRFAAIQTWIREQHANDIDAALDGHPLIALRDGQQLLDGWHRLIVWLRQPGRRFPAAIVGSPRKTQTRLAGHTSETFRQWARCFGRAMSEYHFGYRYSEGGCFGCALAIYEHLQKAGMQPEIHVSSDPGAVHAWVEVEGEAVDQGGLFTPNARSRAASTIVQPAQLEGVAAHYGVSPPEFWADVKQITDPVLAEAACAVQ